MTHEKASPTHLLPGSKGDSGTSQLCLRDVDMERTRRGRVSVSESKSSPSPPGVVARSGGVAGGASSRGTWAAGFGATGPPWQASEPGQELLLAPWWSCMPGPGWWGGTRPRAGLWSSWGALSLRGRWAGCPPDRSRKNSEPLRDESRPEMSSTLLPASSSS